jgi:predicted TIM-barrel fold metal-dependent hydrolase
MRRYLPLAIIVLLALIIIIFTNRTPSQIVNAHESVETPTEGETLVSSMSKTGVDLMVLHGIPYELLHYDAESAITYTNLDANNSYIYELSKKYPEKIAYFCGIDPADFEAIEKITACASQGSKGIKLYSGYSFFNDENIDSAEYQKIYEKLVELKLPLMMPVNTEKFAAQLENVLTVNPELVFICSHYCLSSKDLNIIDGLMSKYPNLYVDTSFGHLKYAQEGFKTISDNHENFEKFFKKYDDRILFATDNVITSYEEKDEEWILKLNEDYISILADGKFESESNPNPGVMFDGLNLPNSILKKVFWNNWQALL